MKKLLTTEEVQSLLLECCLYPINVVMRYQAHNNEEEPQQITSQDILVFFADLVLEIFQPADTPTGVWARGEINEFQFHKFAKFVELINKAEGEEDDNQ